MMRVNKIDRFYDLIPGYFFGFLTLAVGLLGAALAMFLYILEDPSFSIFTNFISD